MALVLIGMSLPEQLREQPITKTRIKMYTYILDYVKKKRTHQFFKARLR